ncbi:fumarate/nitrate reduction transcriptional regulator Fnr [Porticoccaceae bacterium]|nr:fumarate/nitrate reduction transcriptional regulator Fnr [Porticoccaceae bacterium]
MQAPKLSIKPTNCHDCRMSALCLPLAMEYGDLDRLDKVIQRTKPLHKNQSVFYAGDTFSSVYAIRSGSIKAYCVSDDGTEQVTGFYLPGEIFGWDGIADDTHKNTAVALETTAVCEIPFNKFEELSTSIPTLQRHFMQLMAREITSDQQLITLLGKNSAEERIASLLLSISARLGRRKLSPTRFRLPMSRADIGNYLGLTVETVSRVFSRFQASGYIKCDKKEVEILNLSGLSNLVQTCAEA